MKNLVLVVTSRVNSEFHRIPLPASGSFSVMLDKNAQTPVMISGWVEDTSPSPDEKELPTE